jgi:hypothetical protein
MQAVRTLKALPQALPSLTERDPYVVMLGEVVAELAERVELLETRERLGRVARSRFKEGTAKARE